jgi:integrase
MTGAVRSIRKELSLIKTVFKIARLNKLITNNPAADLPLPLIKEDSDKEPFVRRELKKIVDAATVSADPVIKFGTLIGTYHGTRAQDWANLTKEDISVVDGMVVMRVDVGKTAASRRRFVVHPAVLAAGFMQHVESVTDGPIFTLNRGGPNGDLAKHGRNKVDSLLRSIGVWQKHRKGVHSLRHSWKSIVREYVKRDDVSDYLSGSAAGNESAKYGVYPLPTLAAAISKIPADVTSWPLD